VQATGDAADLRRMQFRALDAVARRGLGTPSLLPCPLAGAPDESALRGLLAGLAALRAAVPAGLAEDDALAGTGAADRPVEVTGRRSVAREALAQSGDLVAAVGEASRRAAAGLAACGHEPAADVADVLMTVALALRILAEFERSAIPAL
jgi:hypothetical protein